MDLRHGRLEKRPADGVEQKMGFLGQEPRGWSDSTLRDISFKVFGAKPEILEFSPLDITNVGGTFLLLEGL